MFKVVDNIIISFIDYDEGKPVVLLHDWDKNLDEIDSIGSNLNSYRKIILDFPGFGDSEEPDRAYSLDDYADVLRKLLLDLGIEKPIIIGQSFGGKVAIKYAAKYEVEKLVLLSTSYANCIKSTKENIFYSFKETKLGNYMRNMFGSEEYKKLSPIMKETFIKVNSESVLNDVKNVDAPTLLMNFKDDNKVLLEMSKVLAYEMKNASIIRLRETNSNIYKNPEVITNILNKYFEGYKVRKRIK